MKELNEQALVWHKDELIFCNNIYAYIVLSIIGALNIALFYTVTHMSIDNLAQYKWWLLSAWFSEIASLIFILSTFVISSINNAYRMTVLYSYLQEWPDKLSENHWTDSWSLILSIVAGIFSIVGLITFSLLFVIA